MESGFQAHPVPQNVTNFEFHLVGDMTLKQFGYLASGLALAYILFITLASAVPLVGYPLLVISAATGAAFAFLPIQDRPLDHWVGAFFSAIFKPTKRSYKSAILQKEDPLFKNRVEYFLRALQRQKVVELPKPSLKPKTTLFGISTPAPTTNQPAALSQPAGPSTPPVIAPLPNLPPSSPSQNLHPVSIEPNPIPSDEQLKQTVELAKEAQIVQKKILETEREINQIKSNAARPGEDPKQFLQNFQELLGELQLLNQKASEISRQSTIVTAQPVTKVPPATTKAKSIPSMSLTSVANIINGIVTDAPGNYAEGAIIVAHDRQGIPVRALKTNKLGQFIAATPLANGVYTITVEKDSLVFDSVEIELNSSVLKPIIISARKAFAGGELVNNG